MKYIIELEETWDVWGSTHDVMAQFGFNTTMLDCCGIFQRLPLNITCEALMFGFNDTCYREKLYEYVAKTYHSTYEEKS